MIELNYTLFIQLFGFIVLLIVLNKILYKPVQTFLQERQKRQDDALSAAKTDREETAKIGNEYKSMLSDARKQALQIQNEMVSKAEEEASAELASFRETQQAQLKEDLSKLEEDKQMAREGLAKEIDTLADAVVSRVTQNAN